MSFKSLFAPFTAVLLCLFLAACASMAGPREVELPLAKLQAGLDKRFPMRPAMLELFRVELSRPQLAMLPEQNRIALTVDALVAPPLLRKSWQGTMVLSGRLFIDPVRSAVMLAEPRVERVDIEGADVELANVLLNKVFVDMPVYHFNPDDLRRGGVQFVPTRLTTSARGLLVSVEPVK